MILDDLLTSKYEPSSDQLTNIKKLLLKLNVLEQAFGAKLKVTSGFRSWPDHLRVYQKINDQRVIQRRPEIPVPIHSAHLLGNAADIEDEDKDLQSFLADEKFLKDNDLWSEGFAYCSNWVHLQIVPYASWEPGGSRFFKP